jgi:2-polyprenyl-6-methoxyphenol hydroxylase-like FAD-dependent oxidoreductase
LRQAYDVVVVGGGTAGVIAGIAAARTGARTLLVEQYGSLGGVLSLGMSLKGVHDAEGCKALGGIGEELIARARAMQGATEVVQHPRHGSLLGQDPEAVKMMLLQMVHQSGLHLLLHSFLVDALTDRGRVQAVQVANVSRARPPGTGWTPRNSPRSPARIGAGSAHPAAFAAASAPRHVSGRPDRCRRCRARG